MAVRQVLDNKLNNIKTGFGSPEIRASLRRSKKVEMVCDANWPVQKDTDSRGLWAVSFLKRLLEGDDSMEFDLATENRL